MNAHYLIKKLFSLAIFIIIILLYGSCTPPPPVAVSTLTISPEKVGVGQVVYVAVNAFNPDKNTVKDYKANLTINDVIVETRQITINAGETSTITFQYIPAAPGIFNAEINGQKGAFEVLRLASFVTENFTLFPESPVTGQEIKLSADIRNEGELQGTYRAVLKLDGQESHSSDLLIEAGQTVTTTANCTFDTSGMHIIEFCNSINNVKVNKPAEFKAISINVNPGTIVAGETASVTATITNFGETRATSPVFLSVNDAIIDSREVTLNPGASSTIEFLLIRDKGGTFKLSILGSSTTLTVKELKKYSSESYHFSLSYPPDFSLDDSNPTNIFFESGDSAEMSILVDFISVSATPQSYFDSFMKDEKELHNTWTVANQGEIREKGAVVGYQYDYSYTSTGDKKQGKGLLLKKGGLGFQVTFESKESDWEKNKNLAAICLNSFASPTVAAGAYSGSKYGIDITLPEEWSLIETGSAKEPFIFINPYNQPEIMIKFVVETVPSGMTAQKYIETAAAQMSSLNLKTLNAGVFQFASSASGYETTFVASSSGQTAKMRIIALAANSRMYTGLFIGYGDVLDAQANAINQLMRSLVVYAPQRAGVNKNESLFLLGGEMPTLDPALSEDSPEDIISALFSGLVRIDKDLKVVPDLAEKWTISSDGLTYTFYLRQNAKFHDGKQVTAKDVKYSWERACDPSLKSPKAAYFLNDIIGATDRLTGKASDIRGIKIIDDYTIEISIDAAKQYFLSKLAQPVTYIVDQVNVSQGDSWFEKPNGTGPFKLKSWEKDNQIVLERYDGFYTGPSKLKNIVFSLFAGDPMSLYESGEIDIAGVSSANQEKVLDINNPLNKELLTDSSAGIFYIGFNVSKPPFDDLKVRQAFAMAIDVDKIIEVAYKGKADRASGYIPLGVPGFDSSLQALPFDVNRARQLITESKYQTVENLPSITYYTLYATSPADQAILGMFKQNLGVQIKVETISEIETYMARARGNEFQIFLSGWIADYLDPQNFLDILFQSQSTENHFGYSNPKVDSDLISAASIPDESVRLQKYQDIQKQLLADLPAVPLCHNRKSYELVKPYVKGYSSALIAINQWRDIYVEAH